MKKLKVKVKEKENKKEQRGRKKKIDGKLRVGEQTLDKFIIRIEKENVQRTPKRKRIVEEYDIDEERINRKKERKETMNEDIEKEEKKIPLENKVPLADIPTSFSFVSSIEKERKRKEEHTRMIEKESLHSKKKSVVKSRSLGPDIPTSPSLKNVKIAGKIRLFEDKISTNFGDFKEKESRLRDVFNGRIRATGLMDDFVLTNKKPWTKQSSGDQ